MPSVKQICFNARVLSFAAFTCDVSAVVATWLAAYLIRFNGIPPEPFLHGALMVVLWVAPVYALMFRAFGLYRGMWVFASLPDLMRIVKAVVAGALLVTVVSAMLQPFPPVPRSVLAVAPILLFVAMGGARGLYRATKEFYRYGGLVAQGSCWTESVALLS